jgi:hypothetical protein
LWVPVRIPDPANGPANGLAAELLSSFENPSRTTTTDSDRDSDSDDDLYKDIGLEKSSTPAAPAPMFERAAAKRLVIAAKKVEAERVEAERVEAATQV